MMVLVVDDDPTIRLLLQMALEHDGHKVTVMNNGLDAIHFAVRTPPDLLVVDVVMPGVNGLDVTRRLREHADTKTLPIVLLTGRDTDADLVAAWQSGADACITKSASVVSQLRQFIDAMPVPGG